MKIPATGRKKALIVVDLQPAFIQDNNRYIAKNIIELIQKEPYDAYVDAVFFNEEDSLWKVQKNWMCPKDEDTRTLPEAASILKEKDSLTILKSSRSAFKGEVDLAEHLSDKNIEEVHLVGTETHDCIMATALDAFDLGFLPFVIEECITSGTRDSHEMGLKLLQIQSMTNNECIVETKEI
jgi:nicotinamidase-related amidase